MLNRNRAEGVAQLGEHLLTFENSDEFDSTDQAFESFCQQFETTIQGAQRLIKEQEKNNDDIETYSSCLTYEGAQIVLLKVLGKKGDVDEDLVQRAMKGLITGQFKLTQEEALSIARAALSLSLAEYIQCLLQLDNFVGQVPEFLLTWCEKHI